MAGRSPLVVVVALLLLIPPACAHRSIANHSGAKCARTTTAGLTLKVMEWNVLAKSLGNVYIPRTMLLPPDKIEAMPPPLSGMVGDVEGATKPWAWKGSVFEHMTKELNAYYSMFHVNAVKCEFSQEISTKRPGIDDICFKSNQYKWCYCGSSQDCDLIQTRSCWAEASGSAVVSCVTNLCESLGGKVKDIAASSDGSAIVLGADTVRTLLNTGRLKAGDIGLTNDNATLHLYPLQSAVRKLLPGLSEIRPLIDALKDEQDRVMSWDVRRPKITDIARDQQPDFLGMVELDDLSLAQKIVDSGYDGFSVCNPVEGYIGFFWKKDQWECEGHKTKADGTFTTQAFSAGNKMFTMHECRKRGDPFITVLVVLAHLMSGSGVTNDKQRLSNLMQLDEAIRDRTGYYSHLVVMGDFNSDLIAHGLYDSFKEKGGAFDLVGESKLPEITLGGIKLRAANAAEGLRPTSFTPCRSELLDVIWVGGKEPPKSVQDVSPFEASTFIPNAEVPSDHVPVVVEVEFDVEQC